MKEVEFADEVAIAEIGGYLADFALSGTDARLGADRRP
jgi:hypothetical protein